MKKFVDNGIFIKIQNTEEQFLKHISFLQVVAEMLSLVLCVVQGNLYSSMERSMRCSAWAVTRQSIETRVDLECEKEHQEHLLLSVMPAYIAAEVRSVRGGIRSICCFRSCRLILLTS